MNCIEYKLLNKYYINTNIDLIIYMINTNYLNKYIFIATNTTKLNKHKIILTTFINLNNNNNK